MSQEEESGMKDEDRFRQCDKLKVISKKGLAFNPHSFGLKDLLSSNVP